MSLIAGCACRLLAEFFAVLDLLHGKLFTTGGDLAVFTVAAVILSVVIVDLRVHKLAPPYHHLGDCKLKLPTTFDHELGYKIRHIEVWLARRVEVRRTVARERNKRIGRICVTTAVASYVLLREQDERTQP